MSAWAIIKTGGKQYKVEEGKVLIVDGVDAEKKDLSFGEVLLLKNDKGLSVGNPLVNKAQVKAKFVENFKDKKVRVVKFKSKSKYLRTRGHRQQKVRLLVEKIVS